MTGAKAISSLAKNETLTFCSLVFKSLVHRGLIRGSLDSSCHLTEAGAALYLEMDHQRRETHKRNILSCISIVISILALGVSVLSIILR